MKTENGYFKESIQLKENNKFIYHMSMHMMGHSEIQGNYTIIGDSLRLDSYPQRDKIMVFESFKGNKKKSVFEITNKHGYFVNCKLHLLFKDGTTSEVWAEVGTTEIVSRSIKSFYLVATNGITSPVYTIEGSNTNYFKVLFETIRIFENEVWLIKDDKIVPRGGDGTIQTYRLSKE